MMKTKPKINTEINITICGSEKFLLNQLEITFMDVIIGLNALDENYILVPAGNRQTGEEHLTII